jgi:proline iminopeptidase
VKLLCDTLGIQRPIVFGGSFGGFVAMSYATRHPSHPAALGLFVTAARDTPVEEMVEAFRSLGGDEVAELVRIDYEHSTPETSARFMEEAMPFMSRHPDAIALTQREVARTVRNQDVELHFINGEIKTMDFRGALARVDGPTLVVSGAMDPVCPPSTFHELVAALPEHLVEGHLIKGAGHFVALDVPEEFQRITTDFVLRHTAASDLDSEAATP